jgi:8-amino-7-oxononanoate synthase
MFYDLGGILADHRYGIAVDAGLYPVGQWGMRWAGCNGALVVRFAHFNPGELTAVVKRILASGRQPVIAIDGYCPGCGKMAPLAEFIDLAQNFGAYLIIDDTQTLGLLGKSPDWAPPYGIGGGGIMQFCNLKSPRVVLISSLAKGFGVPIAVLAGANNVVRAVKMASHTRSHCSPPSRASIMAGLSALKLNRIRGEQTRSKLVSSIRFFKHRMQNFQIQTVGGLLPMQTLVNIRGDQAITLHQKLEKAGISTILHNNENNPAARISVIITAAHSHNNIATLTDALRLAEKLARRERVNGTQSLWINS